MTDKGAVAILVVFGYALIFVAGLTTLCVVELSMNTDLNNWILALCAWATAVVVGYPFRKLMNALARS